MKTVKIGRRAYKIRYEAGPLLDDSNCWGYCDVNNHVIAILNSLNKKEKFEILCHEILHAIEEEYSLPIPHKLIRNLEEPLADLLRNNYSVKRK